MQHFSCPVFLGISLLLVQAPAKTAELPAFQPGLWEYQRTVLNIGDVHPQKSSLRKCSDPTSEIRLKLDELKHKGCQFSQTLSRGSHYQSTWRCPSSSGPLVVRDTMTVNSTSSYQDDNQIKASGRITHSVTVANRVGDCPASQSGLSPGIARALAPRSKHP
jgi:hypothetical protein